MERDASHAGEPAHMRSGSDDPREPLLQVTATDKVAEVSA
jgi:hypothetical protein